MHLSSGSQESSLLFLGLPKPLLYPTQPSGPVLEVSAFFPFKNRIGLLTLAHLRAHFPLQFCKRSLAASDSASSFLGARIQLVQAKGPYLEQQGAHLQTLLPLGLAKSQLLPGDAPSVLLRLVCQAKAPAPLMLPAVASPAFLPQLLAAGLLFLFNLLALDRTRSSFQLSSLAVFCNGCLFPSL